MEQNQRRHADNVRERKFKANQKQKKMKRGHRDIERFPEAIDATVTARETGRHQIMQEYERTRGTKES